MTPGSALGPGEALTLEVTDIHPDYLEVREGKTLYRPRKLTLTDRVREMLEKRLSQTDSRFVFPGRNPAKPMRESSLAHLHTATRRKLKLPEAFVLYCLRHTALTRIGEAGAGAYEIMRIAGHSSIATSQRYVHPSSEALSAAIARLDAANKAAWAGKRTDTTTDTSDSGSSVTH